MIERQIARCLAAFCHDLGRSPRMDSPGNIGDG